MVLGVLVLATCAGCAGLVWVLRPVDEPVTDADRAVLLTIEDLEPHLDLEETIDPGLATLTRVRRANDVTINYAYEQPGVLVSTEIASSGNARNDMRGFTPALLNLASGKDTRFTELPGVLIWGDQAKVFLLTKTSTGAKVGNIIVVRKGRRMATWSMVGIYVDDAESVDELLGDELDALERWTDRSSQ